ncbi:cellulose biosynthesis cyclic di-GMP-binding regulatory protein BcsB, partial [Salmonella enterica subsp. enterica serovar 1,4,[5],12:i:-]|nr:cellulose biosynthesis cyclic di-GMP-binding regulatory protein BcsB [Salmonella enterica subsp. enterica serovar 1,4,[5],12:i:-]
LPMVFAGQPDLAQQRAAGILASWFGSKAQWRGQSFPTLYNALPTQHAVVFATNKQRPDFLRDYPAVNGPTVEMISHPDNPYVKLLLIQGRDDNDLITAVKGIAQGDILFRGQNVTVDKVEQLAPRQPYDAP